MLAQLKGFELSMNLVVFDIGGMGLGDQAILLIAANLTQLTDLLVSRNRVRREGALAIAYNLPKLKVLDISNTVPNIR